MLYFPSNGNDIQLMSLQEWNDLGHFETDMSWDLIFVYD